MALGPRARVLIIAAAAFAALAALVWYLSTAYWSQPATPLAVPRGVETVGTPVGRPAPTAAPAAEPSPQATPAASPPPEASPPPAATPAATAQPQSPAPGAQVPAGRLLIPVAGVRPEQLQDTFSDARSEGRRHDAIDIVAPRGTPVLAAADGRVVKLFRSEKGGLTVYQLGTDERTVYYYAHLDRYADGISEGHFARRGETIAYVGDTGNATPGNHHLHFQVYTVTDPKKFWNGENLNPYDLLR
ncbi:MAG TPA: M23 family metallopeptidase [Pyrinomonadaceae bacterium]|nr:M23 family metallopeptidase [Pyrinomonadaceae bacterium]